MIIGVRFSIGTNLEVNPKATDSKNANRVLQILKTREMPSQ
jgi:hypothetical protein